MFKAVRIDLILIYVLSSSERAAVIENPMDLLKRGALDIGISRVLDCAEADDRVSAGDCAGVVMMKA